MYKKALLSLIGFVFLMPIALAQTIAEEPQSTYLLAVINTDEEIEVGKSTIFDASQSFIPYLDREITYSWDFGDGNRNEGIEVLHAYTEQGPHTVTFTI